MASNISEEETQQLHRTVEMFEAITESQPDDYQSLEILKEAYNKLGRRADSLRISKLLAGIYVSLGQISQAILEYEGILQECPDDAKVVAALAELETKTAKINVPHSAVAPSSAEDSKPTPPAGVPAGAPVCADLNGIAAKGDRTLADMLIAEKIVTAQAVEPLLQTLKRIRNGVMDKGQPASLCQLLVNEQIAKMDDLLDAICRKSGLPYLPLPIYDVDRDIACLLPFETCWKLCLLPFDLISRSVLIATANPLDAEARQQAAALLDYSIFWYVSSPMEIAAVLPRAHGLENTRNHSAKS